MDANTDIRVVYDAVDKTEAPLRSVKQNMDGVDKAASSAGKGASSALAPLKSVASIAGGFVIGQALTSLPGLMSGAAKEAGALELQQKKINTVFGESRGIVDEWAAKSAAGMGLTKTQASGLAAGLADLLVPMGMSRDAAATMSTDIIGLSGALAEWSGGTKSAAEVSDILQKALLGETDGLKALGISISAADISARLAAEGNGELEGSARQQAEALAIQAMLFEKSTDAQTAFANGAGSSARIQAENTARMAEAKEQLLTGLAPALTMITGLIATALPILISFGGTLANAIGAILRSEVLPALQEFGAFFQAELLPALREFGAFIVATVIPALAAFWQNDVLPKLQAMADILMGVLIPALVGLVTTVGSNVIPVLQTMAGFIGEHKELLGGFAIGITALLVPALVAWAVSAGAAAIATIAAAAPIIALVAAVGLLGTGVILLVKHWDDITAKVPLLGAAVDLVVAVFRVLAGFITGTLLGALRDALGAIGPLVDALGTIGSVVGGAALAGIQTYIETWRRIIDVMRDVVGAFAPLAGAVGSAVDGALEQAQRLITWATNLGGDIAAAVGSLAGTLAGPGADLIAGLWDAAQGVWSTVAGWLATVGEMSLSSVGSLSGTLTGPGGDLIGGLWDGAQRVWSTVAGWLATLGSLALSAVGSLLSTLSGPGTDIIQGLLNAVTLAWAGVTWFTRLEATIAAAVGSGLRVLAGFGADIVQGLINGVSGAWGAFVSHLSGLLDLLPGPLRKVLGMLSPSRVMAEEVGVPLVQGIAAGAAEEFPRLFAFMAAAGGALVSQARGIGSAVADALAGSGGDLVYERFRRGMAQGALSTMTEGALRQNLFNPAGYPGYGERGGGGGAGDPAQAMKDSEAQAQANQAYANQEAALARMREIAAAMAQLDPGPPGTGAGTGYTAPTGPQAPPLTPVGVNIPAPTYPGPPAGYEGESGYDEEYEWDPVTKRYRLVHRRRKPPLAPVAPVTITLQLPGESGPVLAQWLYPDMSSLIGGGTYGSGGGM